MTESGVSADAEAATENSGRFQYFANGGGRKMQPRDKELRTNEECNDEAVQGDPRDFPPSLLTPSGDRAAAGSRAGPANNCNAAPPSLPAVPKSGLIQVRGTRGGRGSAGTDTGDRSRKKEEIALSDGGGGHIPSTTGQSDRKMFGPSIHPCNTRH